MFPVTITLTNAAQLAAVLAALQPAGVPLTPEVPQATSAPATDKAERKVPEQKTAAPVPEPEAAEHAADPVSYDQVSKAITAAVTKNRQKVVDTLAKFGAKKGTELKPEQYAAFLQELAS